MSAPDRMVGVRSKVERAKQHISQLQLRLRTFAKTEPYRISTKRDPETRELLYYVESISEVPVTVLLILGDVLNNLRSALDHVAYQLVMVGTGTAPGKHVYFPIAEDATSYQAAISGKVKGARQGAIKVIEAIEAYKGGKGHQLWVLNKLNNIDKHRLLLAVLAHYQGPSIGAFVHPGIQNLTVIYDDGRMENLPPVPMLAARMSLPGGMRPLKAGDILLRNVPEAEVNQHAKFYVDVAIIEPEIGESQSLLELLLTRTREHMVEFMRYKADKKAAEAAAKSDVKEELEEQAKEFEDKAQKQQSVVKSLLEQSQQAAKPEAKAKLEQEAKEAAKVLEEYRRNMRQLVDQAAAIAKEAQQAQQEALESEKKADKGTAKLEKRRSESDNGRDLPWQALGENAAEKSTAKDLAEALYGIVLKHAEPEDVLYAMMQLHRKGEDSSNAFKAAFQAFGVTWDRKTKGAEKVPA